MTAHMVLMTLASLFTLGLLGCSSSTPHSQRIATIELYDSSPVMLVKQINHPRNITANIASASDGRVYRRALLYISDNNGNRDSVAMLIESSGAPGMSSSTTLRCLLPENLAEKITSASLSVGLEQGSVITIHPAQFQHPDTAALTLTPFIRPGDGVVATIGASVTRHRVIEGEYLPSSEDLRVILRSGFKVVWQSNEGLAFLTVITPVRPETVGEVSIYSLDWDGTGGDGQPLPPGEYTADIVIPSKPAPYQTHITFTWPLSKN